MKNLKIAPPRLHPLRFILAMFMLFAAGSMLCNAQSCGSFAGGNACATYCAPAINYPLGAPGGNTGEYLQGETVYCGKCPAVYRSIIFGPCAIDDATKVVSSDTYDKLVQLAGGREILVPGCGRSFKRLELPRATQASTLPSTPSAKRLANIVDSLTAIDWRISSKIGF